MFAMSITLNHNFFLFRTIATAGGKSLKISFINIRYKETNNYSKLNYSINYYIIINFAPHLTLKRIFKCTPKDMEEHPSSLGSALAPQAATDECVKCTCCGWLFKHTSSTCKFRFSGMTETRRLILINNLHERSLILLFQQVYAHAIQRYNHH